MRGKSPCIGAAGSELYVGFDKRLLNFDLLFRKFEDAVFVDLVADLAEKVCHLRGYCRPGGGRFGLFGETVARRKR